MKRDVVGVFGLAALLAVASGCREETSARQGISDEMEETIETPEALAYLDGPTYRSRVSWPEHVVNMYELVEVEGPSDLEFTMLTLLRDDIGLKRSDVLAVALSKRAEQDPALVRRFVVDLEVSELIPSPAVQKKALGLELLSAKALKELVKLQEAAKKLNRPLHYAGENANSRPGEAYETYFGYMHAHTGVSDGKGKPLEAYEFAKNHGGFDFFALTDHGELIDMWPWEHEWEDIRGAADITDEPGRFAALWGFEWSNPILGHLCVINSKKRTSMFQRLTLNAIFDWISDRPETIGRFNHPGDFDFLGLEFDDFDLRPGAVEQMVGMELWNKDVSFDEYYYAGGYEGEFSFIDEANRKGWRLGALGGGDDHDGDWGLYREFRTAVLAKELTREGILEAYRARRFYSTEDADLYLDVRAGGYPMGARVFDVPRVFEVELYDASGDEFRRVTLYRNGVPVQAVELSGFEDSAILEDGASSGEDYYYVVAQQTDDNDGNGRRDEAISSPIWFASTD